MPHMESQCWVWTASLTRGYGQIAVYGRSPQKTYRIALELAGIDIAGAHVHHRCENKACVRADHMEVVGGIPEHAEKHRSGCSAHGEDAMLVYRSGRNVGKRYCGECNREKATQRRRAAGKPTRDEWLDQRFGADRPRR